MSILKQRVPLGTVSGADVFITVEWLKDLQKIEGGSSASTTSGVTAADLAAEKADLIALITALARRVTTLEGGYQV